MNVLAGRATYGNMEGSIFTNGEKCSLGDIKKSFGFVPQDDIILESLTVRQNLQYCAQLRLPESMSAHQKKTIVENTLNLLQLENVADSIVGSVEERGISGGQRKRVNM